MAEQILELKSLNGSLENIEVSLEGPDFIQFSSFREGDIMKIRMNAVGEEFGDYEGRIIVNQNEEKHTIPFMVHYTKGSISTVQQNGELKFRIYHPEEWNFAKITAINSNDGSTETISTNPGKSSSMNVFENGQYWIHAKIRVGEESFDAYEVIDVNSVPPGTTKPFEFFDIPEKQIGIIAVIVVVMGLIGLKISRTKTKL